MGPLRRSSLAWLVLASQAIAAPTIVVDHVDNIDDFSQLPASMAGVGCGRLMRKAICCSGDLLGLVHIGCAAPYPAPSNPVEFAEACAKSGKTPLCCTANLVSPLTFPKRSSIH